MITFAVPPIGGKGWFGGWMYMQNLVRALAGGDATDIETVLFIGPDRFENPEIRLLADLPRTRVVSDPAFDETGLRCNVGWTLATGRNAAVLGAYNREKVDVALDPALYLGWRSEIPSIAWIPDFQHRHMPHMFSRGAYWKRDLGFRAQIGSAAAVMLSSEDAERDCLEFYPAAKGRTEVARFAVPVSDWPDADAAWARLRQEGIPEDFIFLPNQLWQHKNHGLAIAAAALLARRGSRRIILATGHGHDPRFPDYPDALKAQIRASGAEANFRLMGSVDHALVQAMMIGANALLNSSRFEGWSTTVEEGKSVATPLLLSDLRVHREQAPDAVFFGTDDAEALANAIDVAAPRSLASIRASLKSAASAGVTRQSEFAAKVAQIIRKAAHGALERRAL
ncbi:glycosyltransferase [Sphingorhabdus sp. IMCC26285]|uniref:Glycosyltransferase n=1 Tax=Sphingorhabdus profundilacus TaxID=2509718 RepID=A0A6I4LY23_9SPHN|nr:glycosyltransferase [Sphingorhabdus profundilacus]MVZ98457.1 glycosyltransferase [Sphingorhabdus profundilacus]